MEVILIRHGQSESNARLTTALDPDLTELGRKQAEATADYLLTKPILNSLDEAVVFVSPFRRTLQTCRYFAERASLRAHAYPDMCEHFAASNDAYRSFVGLSEEQIEREYPFVILDGIFRCQGAWWPSSQEDLAAIYNRACRVRDALYALYGNTQKQVVIFSHAEPIGRLIEAMQHAEPAQGWPPWTENCGICRLVVSDPSLPAELVVMNDISHLQERGIVSPTQPGIDARPIEQA